MTWWLWLGAAVCSVAFAVVGLNAYGSARWATNMTALTRKLDAGRIDDQVRLRAMARYDSSELGGLPAPVQRYFRAVLKEHQPIIAAATVELAGTFNMSATGEQWKPFTSRQRVVTSRAGFLWDAEIPLLPGVNARVIDSYIDGVGLLRAALLGLFTVAHVQGRGEIARGELMRFFAEMAWYPTALLPSQGVRWEGVNDRSAHATIVEGPITLTLLFKFNDADLIESVGAAARGAMVGREMVMTPWEGSWSDYQARGGVMVPIEGEAAWLRPNGRSPYFRGKVTSLNYELSPAERER